MDIRQLRYFVAIVESGSLTKAAERVFVAQPALSQQMSALEEDLHVQLLVRSPRGVFPTQAGEQLYAHALSILRQLDAARQNVRLSDSEGRAGVVSLGLPPTLSTALGSPLVARLRTEYPAIRLQLYENMGAQLQDLRAQGRLDMSIHYRDQARPGTTLEVLFEEELFLVGAPPGTEPTEAPCKLSALSGVPMLVTTAEQGMRHRLDRSFDQAGIDLNIVAEIDAHCTILAAAEAGFGCAVVPASAIPARFRKTNPVRRIIEPTLYHPVALCWNSADARPPVVRTVERLLREIVQEKVTSQAWPGVTLPYADWQKSATSA